MVRMGVANTSMRRLSILGLSSRPSEDDPDVLEDTNMNDNKEIAEGIANFGLKRKSRRHRRGEKSNNVQPKAIGRAKNLLGRKAPVIGTQMLIMIEKYATKTNERNVNRTTESTKCPESPSKEETSSW